MNKEIELHDSTLCEIIKTGSEVIIVIDKAIIHHSEGKPGVNNGTCWLQTVKMFFLDAQILSTPKEMPINISDGDLMVKSNKYSNMFELFTDISGEIDFNLLTAYNEHLHIKASKLKIETIGAEEYLEEFPGI